MYPDRKETTIYMRRNNTQNNTSTQNTKYKINIQKKKNENEHKANNKKHNSGVLFSSVTSSANKTSN
jgi:hypothetical protein